MLTQSTDKSNDETLILSEINGLLKLDDVYNDNVIAISEGDFVLSNCFATKRNFA